jgi:hypothetical protein
MRVRSVPEGECHAWTPGSLETGARRYGPVLIAK